MFRWTLHGLVCPPFRTSPHLDQIEMFTSLSRLENSMKAILLFTPVGVEINKLTMLLVFNLSPRIQRRFSQLVKFAGLQ